MYLKGGCKEVGDGLFSVIPSARTRGHGRNLEHMAFPLNSRQHICAVQVMEHWHRLPRGCGVSSSETIKTQLDVGLGTLLWVSLLELGLAQMDPEGSSNPKWSVIG